MAAKAVRTGDAGLAKKVARLQRSAAKFDPRDPRSIGNQLNTIGSSLQTLGQMILDYHFGKASAGDIHGYTVGTINEMKKLKMKSPQLLLDINRWTKQEWENETDWLRTHNDLDEYYPEHAGRL